MCVPALLLGTAAGRYLLTCCLSGCTAKHPAALGGPSGDARCHRNTSDTALSALHWRAAPIILIVEDSDIVLAEGSVM